MNSQLWQQIDLSGLVENTMSGFPAPGGPRYSWRQSYYSQAAVSSGKHRRGLRP